MPTAHCNYPHHHSGPSGGPPAGLVAAIVAGALIILEWRTIVVVLAVVVALAVAAGVVVALWHSAHSEPYDAPEQANLAAESRWELSAEQAPRESALQVRVGQLERQLAERDRPAITTGPRVVHQHVHLHGVGREQLAELGINPDGHHGRTVGRRVLPQRYLAVTAEDDQQ